MRWKDLRRSENVRDVRGEEGGGGMRAGMPISLGRGGALAGVAVLVIAYLIGGPEAVQNLLEGGGGDAPTAEQGSPLTANDEASQFVAAILGSTEDVWGEIFASSGRRYETPELTLFDGAVQSACGYASTAVGPFYCPNDHRVYLDTAFFADLARLGGPGDFAQAYVIGHEVGHHVQNLLGDMRRAANAGGGAAASGGQVALELQADCYAGVWAHHANQTNHVLEPGDVEEGIAAAEAIGDDRLQRNAGRRVTPDSFTHGTSEQRAHWLGVGLKSGDPKACDTFRDLR
jgi:predicted metalloprotease